MSWLDDRYNLALLKPRRKEFVAGRCPLCRKFANALTGGRIGLHWLVINGLAPCRASYRRPDELNKPWATVKWLGYYGYILYRDVVVRVKEIPSHRKGFGLRDLTLAQAKRLVAETN